MKHLAEEIEDLHGFSLSLPVQGIALARNL